MSTRRKAGWCLVSEFVDLRGVRMRKLLHKGIPVFLRFGDVMLRAHKDGLIKAFGLDLRLRIIRCCFEVFHNE